MGDGLIFRGPRHGSAVVGRVEAEVACQFSRAVLTLANFLPNTTPSKFFQKVFMYLCWERAAGRRCVPFFSDFGIVAPEINEFFCDAM